MAEPGTPEWRMQVQEEIVDPDRAIVDPHHHLWQDLLDSTYLLEDLWSDVRSGHKVLQTVFVECTACYREEGPQHLRPVGETEFVASIAKESAGGPGPTIAGIVAHADLTLGEAVEEVLNAHDAAGDGLFRGIRHAGAWAERPDVLMLSGRAPKALYSNPRFREGIRVLGRLGPRTRMVSDLGAGAGMEPPLGQVVLGGQDQHGLQLFGPALAFAAKK